MYVSFLLQNPAFTPDKDVDFELQVSSFSPLGLREDVLKALYNIKVTKPTVIQVRKYREFTITRLPSSK